MCLEAVKIKDGILDIHVIYGNVSVSIIATKLVLLKVEGHLK